MDRFWFIAVALALVAIGSAMVISEIAAQRSERKFFRAWYTEQSYWLTYFCAFVLAAVLLFKAIIG